MFFYIQLVCLQASCDRTSEHLRYNCTMCGGTSEHPLACSHMRDADPGSRHLHECGGCGDLMVVDGDVVSGALSINVDH